LWFAGEWKIPLLAAVAPAFCLCLALGFVFCAKAWMNRRWLKAIALNALVVSGVMGAVVISLHLFASVYMIILHTNQIPESMSLHGEEWRDPSTPESRGLHDLY